MTLRGETLSSFPFFDGLEAKTLKALAKAGHEETVKGGDVLLRQGAPADALFFVLSGRLMVARRTDTGTDQSQVDVANEMPLSNDIIIGYIRAGEPAGEMALLLDEPHSATVYALRDTTVLRIDHQNFDTLLERHADLAARLSRLLLRRARQPKNTQKQASPRVFALIGASRSIDIDQYGADLTKAVSVLGARALHLSTLDETGALEAFPKLESDHDVIILTARVNDTDWYRFVLRHADRFLVFARRDAVPPSPFPLAPDERSPARRFRLVDLVMVPHGNPACPVTTWRDAVGAERIFFWTDETTKDRLARVITGKSFGLVLSGGGARAYAHIGALKAIKEAHIPLDFVCGTSMGAIIAACFALGWNDAEIEYRIKKAFVDSNPLSDFNLPVVALTRGRLVEERLKAHFGDARIEELPTPFFCLSAELTQGTTHVHRDGLLREALRASISLPGILPPVIKGEKLLVDGGLINNFPTNLMAATHRGLNIGIDVARKGTINPDDYADAPGFFGWIRKNGLRAPPPIVGLLMRASTTRRESTMVYRNADIMITPAVPGVDLRSWHAYDTAVSEGYRATSSALAAHGPLI
ncbi:MAG: patatin-like phospholipase family protein [Pseudomonadota bacterium]